jgi:hypothetical protein
MCATVVKAYALNVNKSFLCCIVDKQGFYPPLFAAFLLTLSTRSFAWFVSYDPKFKKSIIKIISLSLFLFIVFIN